MQETNNITISFVILMLLVISVVCINTVSNSEAKTHIKILWGIIILLSCITIILMLFKQKTFAIIFLIIILILATITVILQSKIISYCGDGVCINSECASNCGDCSPALCENRHCDTPMENCINSNDCRCSHGFTCAPNRNDTDEKGCRVISCGDGFCDPPEDASNCCSDCGCPYEHICRQNSCYFIPPKISLNTKIISSSISATTLAGNPQFTTENNTAQPLIGMLVKSTSYLHNAQFNFVIKNMFNDTINAGDIQPDVETPVLWYIKSNNELLKITKNQNLNLTINALYSDSTGENHKQTWNYPITILDRNTLDENGNIDLFITRDYLPKAKTPEAIWLELQPLVKYSTDDTSKIKFPIETLIKKYGNRNDLAVLLASAYDAGNLSPMIVEGPNGYYVRVRNNDKYVILDASKINGTFDNAIVIHPGSIIHDINHDRFYKNYTILSLNYSMIPGALISSKTEIENSCVCANACSARDVAIHSITNNGEVAADICATSIIYASINAGFNNIENRTQCYTILPNKYVEFRHGWQNDAGCMNITAELKIDNID